MIRVPGDLFHDAPGDRVGVDRHVDGGGRPLQDLRFLQVAALLE